MLAVMEASQNAGTSKKDDLCPTPSSHNSNTPANVEDFLQSGRTGRRNALADILGEHASVTSSDLPSKLEGLTTNEKSDTKANEPQPSSSKS